jgi:ribonuclease VapC
MAYLLGEDGGEKSLQVIASRPCFVSSVTLTELEGKLVGRGDFIPQQVQAALDPLLSLVSEVAFDAQCRPRAAFYYARKSPYGLSLGDAACLGTADALGYDVLTAERGWGEIPDLPFQVHLIR